MLSVVGGFIGVSVLLGVWQGFGSNQGLGVGLCFLAVTLYGISFPYAKRFVVPHGLNPLTIAHTQLWMAVLQLVFVFVFFGNIQAVTLSAALSLLALGVYGTGIAFALNQRIIAIQGAVFASTVAYWTPVVAVLAGVLVLQETLHWYEIFGAVIIAVSVMYSQQKGPFAPRTH